MASPSRSEWYRWEKGDLHLLVRAMPRAGRSGFGDIRNGALLVRLKAPPADGKANRELLGYLAGVFGVARGRVELAKGARGREKRLLVRAPRRIPGELVELGLTPPPPAA